MNMESLEIAHWKQLRPANDLIEDCAFFDLGKMCEISI